MQISKHLVNSPVVVLSADYGWTAQMEKVMKSQAFADQSKFEFMKSKRMFEINPRHPMIVELNSRVMEKPEGDESLTDMITSLYMSAVVSAGYQLTPDDATDFAGRVAKLVGGNLNIESDAELAPEPEVTEDEEEEEEEEETEEESADKDEV